MSKSKISSSSPSSKVKAQYFNGNVGISSGKKGRRSKKGNGVMSISTAGTIPDVLPPAPFPHLKGKP